MNKMEELFPHDKIREGQDDLLEAVFNVLKEGKSLIAHAPTGIGKTSGVLSPALQFALNNDYTIFFLTSRHTQHKIVIDTLNNIKDKFKKNFLVADIIGKKWLCAKPGLNKLRGSDFPDYCKNQRLNGECAYFSNIKEKGELSLQTLSLIEQLKKGKSFHAEELKDIAKEKLLCPYEIALLLAKDAKVIIADYSYIFEPHIHSQFFLRINKSLEKSIIIVDEGHNLPNRLRDMMSDSISIYTINNSIKEAKDNSFGDLIMSLEMLKGAFNSLINQTQKEKYATRQEFITLINQIRDYHEFLDELNSYAEIVRAKKDRSWIGSIAKFLDVWETEDETVVRIVKNDQKNSSLSIKSLDPSKLAKPIIENAHSVIMMSGTMTPVTMFSELLGFNKEKTKLLELTSPFPKENRLSLIVPIISTSYKRRNEKEFQKIGYAAGYLSSLVNGNVLIFFPSYNLLNKVKPFFEDNYSRKVFSEQPNMNKSEKQQLLKDFSSNKDRGSTLLAVISGSFGEGIDLPGDLLKAAIIIGIPFSVPNLETKAIIDYYEKKFKKGQDYGYIYPAITYVLQSAGRVIRSETDKGIVVLMDERYAYPHYYYYLPKDWNFTITRDFEPFINDFFKD